MSPSYEPVIGLEVHAVLETRSKMFCRCPLVDSTHHQPNAAVCPVCSGMPGVLPVVNQGAVDYALRVALALGCQIAPVSIFARKSYFYPDLPKGYQISQYEQPLAVNGCLNIKTQEGEQTVRIRRVHLEEDTGKLTHVRQDGESFSLIDYNRSGMPLLEIVSEPDMHSVEAVRAYAFGLRSILQYLGVNSGDLEKGLFRIEPNISLRPVGSQQFGTRTEIKNLNSFRVLERSLAYEIERQAELLSQGLEVVQQTLGWNEEKQVTVPQRSKEDAEDYRYFPEPDLPPLEISPEWIAKVQAELPELPYPKYRRFQQQYSLPPYDAQVLTAERPVADFFEAVLLAAPQVEPKTISNWVTGELFSWLNHHDQAIQDMELPPQALADLTLLVEGGQINHNTGKDILAEMLEKGGSAEEIVARKGLRQVSDQDQVDRWVSEVLAQNPKEVQSYLEGKHTLEQWFFGQVMRKAAGKANPQVVKTELSRQLGNLLGE